MRGAQGVGNLDIFHTPAGLQLAAGVDRTGYARKVTVHAGRLMLLDSGSGLRVYDVSDPIAPSQIGGWARGGSQYDIFIADNLAFIVSSSPDDLAFIDLQDPGNPSEVSTTPLGADGLAVAVDGAYAYVATQLDTLQVFDVSDPTATAPVGVPIPLTDGSGLVPVGDRMWFGTWDGDAGLLDLTDPVQPSVLSQLTAGALVEDVRLGEGLLMVMRSDAAIEFMDPSPTGALGAPIGALEPGQGKALGGIILGDLAVIAAEWRGIRLVDLATRSAPTYESANDTQVRDTRAATVLGGYVYAANQDVELRVYELSCGSTPWTGP